MGFPLSKVSHSFLGSLTLFVPQEIAEYHNLLDEVKINAQVLRADGFRRDPFFQCLLAELPSLIPLSSPGHPIGYALFFFGYSVHTGRIVYMENLYVVSEFRGRGIGRKLLSEVAKVALAADCAEIKFTVSEWNSRVLAWYRCLGAQDKSEIDGWHCLEMDAETLHRLAGDGGHRTSCQASPSTDGVMGAQGARPEAATSAWQE
uniref:N-acetyltransferase domain-containing protein n=1 Tax=Pelusios castaneus TaxID=367368 RepID=A0A8C8S746_9SAUR